MKKLILVLMLFIAIFSDPMSSLTTGYTYTTLDKTISSSTAFDTIATTATITLLSNFQPKRGYRYVLARDALTGTNANSCYMSLVVVAKDINKNTLSTTYVDSITASAAEDYVIGFGNTLIGNYFDIKVIGYGSNGAQIIFNRLYLYKQACYVLNKDFKEAE